MSIFEAVVLEAEAHRLRAENETLRERLIEYQQAAKMDEAPLLRAENAELRAMIKQLEWTRWRFSWFSDFPETCCPICGRQQRLGHAPDCKLAVLLGR